MVKLLQVVLNRSPVGLLGFERGVYRFHYLSSQPGNPAISPLMPTTRMFYESDRLFCVFEQFLPAVGGCDAHASNMTELERLEKVGHYGLGHLSFVNPDRPVVAPRMTLRKDVLLSAKLDTRSAIQALGRGLHPSGVLGLPGIQMRLVHTQPASPYPDSCLYWPDNQSDTGKLPGKVLIPSWEALQQALNAGLETPAFESNPAAGVTLIQRPDLSKTGKRLRAHRLFSLAGLVSGEVDALAPDKRLVLALRLLRFYGQAEPVRRRVETLAQRADWFCPLRQIWLIEDQCWFMP